MFHTFYRRATRWTSLIALACTLLLSACDSFEAAEGASHATPSFASSSLSDLASGSRIVFQSQKDFEETYALLAAGDEASLNAYEKERRFTSMRSAEAADANAAKKGNLAPEDAFVGVIEDPVLSTLVSPDGLIQIGDALYKVGAEYVFEGTAQDAASFASMNEGDLITMKNVSGFLIERETPHIPNPNAPGPDLPDDPDPTPPDTTATPTPPPAPSSACAQLGSKYKLCGRSYLVNYGFIVVAGVTTRVSKRGLFGIYFPIRADAMNHTAVFGSTTVINACTKAYLCYSIFNGASTGTLATTHNATHAGSSASVQTSATRE